MEPQRVPVVGGDETITVTTLTGPVESHPAQVVNQTETAIEFRVPRSVEPCSAVKIEARDVLLLGEVCHARQEGDACVIRVNLEQVLTGVSGLARLNQRLLDESREDFPAARSLPARW